MTIFEGQIDQNRSNSRISRQIAQSGRLKYRFFKAKLVKIT